MIRICYHGRRLKQLFLVGIFYVLLYAVDYLVMAGSLLLLHMDIDTLYNSQYAYIVAALLAKSILVYSCAVFAKKLKTAEEMRNFLCWSGDSF